MSAIFRLFIYLIGFTTSTIIYYLSLVLQDINNCSVINLSHWFYSISTIVRSFICLIDFTTYQQLFIICFIGFTTYQLLFIICLITFTTYQQLFGHLSVSLVLQHINNCSVIYVVVSLMSMSSIYL